ncbi:MAG: IS66 family transposase [Myxococcaceae bacterium]|nr:IS66 family transposase [Myxococcaceae bacterium]
MAELKARLNTNSTNSGKPPSSDGPEVQRRPRKKKGRKRGGQPGHKGTRRQLVPTEACSKVVPVSPGPCIACGGEVKVRPDAPPFFRHQVWEVPEVKPLVTEYQLHAGPCSGCGRWHMAQLPEGVPEGAFGPRLTALVAYMTGGMRLSKRLVKAFLADVMRVPVGLGQVTRLEAQVSSALEVPVEKAHEYVRQQKVANGDETRWRQEGKTAWLWVVATALVTVFRIATSRGSDVARALLKGFEGFFVSDRYSGYAWVDTLRRQVCWAHLLRDFLGWTERSGPAVALGEALVEETLKLFALAQRVRDGTLRWGTFQYRMSGVRAEVARLLREAEVCPDAKVASQAEALLKLEGALFTFMHHPEVPPTNNFAERQLRQAVILRKLSHGTQSEGGSRYVERVLTAVTTLKQQGRDVLGFLTAAVEAQLHGLPPPSLLPTHVSAVAAQAAPTR